MRKSTACRGAPADRVGRRRRHVQRTARVSTRSASACENANRWRDHVMVVAHRGGGMEGDRNRHAGELDRRRASTSIGARRRDGRDSTSRQSRDGEFVVFHDSWLDRTSTCRGELAKRTLAELRTMPPGRRRQRRADRRADPDAARDAGGHQGPRPRQHRQQARASTRCPTSSPSRATWAWPTRSSSSATSGTPSASPEMAGLLDALGRRRHLHADHRRRRRARCLASSRRVDQRLFGRRGRTDRLARATARR